MSPRTIRPSGPSQLQADYPSAYHGQDGFVFLTSITANWDETRLLKAELDRILVIARDLPLQKSSCLERESRLWGASRRRVTRWHEERSSSRKRSLRSYVSPRSHWLGGSGSRHGSSDERFGLMHQPSPSSLICDLDGRSQARRASLVTGPTCELPRRSNPRTPHPVVTRPRSLSTHVGGTIPPSRQDEQVEPNRCIAS
jgi:hypothetical protein